MKVIWKDEAPSLAMLATMFGLAAVTWSSAPERIPIHWTFFGEPDRFGSRFAGLVGLPLIAAAVYLILLFLPRIDPRRGNYDAFRRPYAMIRTAVAGFLLAMEGFIQLWIRGQTASSRLFMPVVAGAVIMLVGNYLPKLQSNWFVGIRTPWTLTSEESWRKTHQLAAWLFVASGAAIVVASVLNPDRSRAVLFGTLMATLLSTAIYSYFVWRNDPHRTSPTSRRPL
ncbi:MAG: SdpI family protein [Vicinamibacterales bacterium]